MRKDDLGRKGTKVDEQLDDAAGDDEMWKRRERRERGKRNVRETVDLADNALCVFMPGGSEGERLSDGGGGGRDGRLRQARNNFLSRSSSQRALFDPQNPK